MLAAFHKRGQKRYPYRYRPACRVLGLLLLATQHISQLRSIVLKLEWLAGFGVSHLADSVINVFEESFSEGKPSEPNKVLIQLNS